MKQTNVPNAILWDMDGTLIDQTKAILKCYRTVIAALGLAAPDEERLLRSMGKPMAGTMALFVPEERLAEACGLFRARFPEMMFDGLEVLPGALEILERCAGQGIAQAIFTNKHGPTARTISEELGFARYVSQCVGSGDTDWHKPEAAYTQYVLELMGAEPPGAVVVGDSPTDVAVAENAGLIAYGVPTGAHSEAELRAAGAVWAGPSLAALSVEWFGA